MSDKTLASGQRSIKEGGKRMLPALCNLIGILILVSVILSCLPLTIPRLMGYEIYNVISGSMEPELPVGSVVYVAAAAPEEIEAKDVIAFWSGGTVVTHRVVENRLTDREFITKGDANAAEDMNAVPYVNLIGRVEYHFPVIGRLMVLYTGTMGKVYVICFAACGAVLNMLAGRLRERGREDESAEE